jgi:short-subunit dehydrogenase
MRLKDSHVVVTGGSRGIGVALGQAFTGAGARVTLVARESAALQAAADGIGATALAADLRDCDGVAARAEAIAPVDVLVHNAGLDAVGAFADLPPAALRDLISVNVLAPAELTRQALPAMLARGRGRIVFVSSLSAHITLPGLAAYSATKAAVSQLADGLRTELRGTGVGITLVELGAVRTDMYASIRGYPATDRAVGRTLALRVQRLLDVDEVASAVVRACRKDRYSVVRPRRMLPTALLARSPQRLGELVTR